MLNRIWFCRNFDKIIQSSILCSRCNNMLPFVRPWVVRRTREISIWHHGSLPEQHIPHGVLVTFVHVLPFHAITIFLCIYSFSPDLNFVHLMKCNHWLVSIKKRKPDDLKVNIDELNDWQLKRKYLVFETTYVFNGIFHDRSFLIILYKISYFLSIVG